MALRDPQATQAAAGEQVRRAIGGMLDRERAHTLVAGVSGGADSMVLAHALCSCAPAYGLHLHIAHFDHALRPESTADAEFVAEQAARWNLPFHAARWEHGGRFPGGMEAAARKARYRFLAGVARDVTSPSEHPVVAVAHHQDDQVETALLNLVRGAGYRGLVGMRYHGPMPEQGNGRRVRLVRPFLYVARQTLRDYAAAHSLEWREDATNAVPDRARTIIRHNVLPELERINAGAVVAIANFAGVDADMHARLERLHAMMLTVCLVESAPGERAVFSMAALRTLEHIDRVAVVNQGIAQTFPGLWDRRYEAAERLTAVLDRPVRASGPHPLVRGLAYTVLPGAQADDLRVAVHHSELLPVDPPHPWLDERFESSFAMLSMVAFGAFSWGGWTLTIEERATWDGPSDNPWEAWLDADSTAEVMLGVPQPGMRFAPLGMEGHTRSLGDFFTDRKVPTALRPGWPLITDAATGEILWVCGLAVSHHAAVRSETRRVLHLRWTQDRQP
jgi:tRNA(Ile)-lysidine synthase